MPEHIEPPKKGDTRYFGMQFWIHDGLTYQKGDADTVTRIHAELEQERGVATAAAAGVPLNDDLAGGPPLPPGGPGGAGAPPSPSPTGGSSSEGGAKPPWWNAQIAAVYGRFEDLPQPGLMEGIDAAQAANDRKQIFAAAEAEAKLFGLLDEPDEQKGMTKEEADQRAAAAPGYKSVYRGFEKGWDFEAIPGIFFSESEANLDARQNGKITVPLGDGTFFNVDPADPNPPLEFDDTPEGIQAAREAARRLGPDFRVDTTSSGFVTVKRGPAEPAKPRLTLTQRIAELAIDGKTDEAFALDRIRDALMAKPSEPEKTTFSLTEATEIARDFAERGLLGPEEFESFVQDLLAMDISAEATATPTGAPRAIFDERTDLPAPAQRFAPEVPVVEVDGRQIPSPPALPTSEEGLWQSTYDSVFAEEIESDSDPEEANDAATRAANEAVTAQGAGAGETRFGLTPEEQAIAGPQTQEFLAGVEGFGPRSEDPRFRLARAYRQGAVDVGLGGRLGAPPTAPGVAGEPDPVPPPVAQRGLDVGALTPAQRSRFFETRPSDDELLQTVSASLTDADLKNLLAGGPQTLSTGPQATGVDLQGTPVTGGTFRNGVSTAGRPTGSRFAVSSEDIGGRFGLSIDEVGDLRTDAKRRKAQIAANKRGLGRLADVGTPPTVVSRVPPFRITRFG